MNIDWNSPELTFGDILVPTETLAREGDIEKRDAYLAEYEAYLQARNPEFSEAQIKRVVADNIGYWSGYYTPDTMRMIKEFFEVKHPVFDRETN